MSGDAAALDLRPAPRWEWLLSSRLSTAVVAALLCLAALLGVAGVWVEQREQAPAQARLRDELRPAQVQTEQLLRAYDDMETGLRGYLLTGDPAALAPYRAGSADVAALSRSLTSLLADYLRASALLQRSLTHGEVWRTQVAVPQIAARARGPVPDDQLLAFVTTGTRVFESLRADVAALSAELGRLISRELARFADAQDNARLLQRSALALALLGVALVGFLLWWTTRPLRRLVEAVTAVAAGHHDLPLPQAGPQEYRQLSRAVERMRRGLNQRSSELARAEHSMARLAERERIAERLRERTVQRLFALGLRFSSLASAGQVLRAAELQELVQETDHIITELRTAIFADGDHRLPD